MSRVSKSEVSRLCEEIDERVNAFLKGPVDSPHLWIDATYVKVRQSGRVVSMAGIITMGVNNDGRGPGHGHRPVWAVPFWTAFVRKLARCGLRAVNLVISDAREGIKATASKVLTANW
jgi:putative transposase